MYPPPLTPPQFEEYLQRASLPDMRCFLIRGTEDYALVGAVNLSGITRRAYQNAVLSYYLGTRHTGHGCMTEAGVLTVDFSLKKEKLHRVEANNRPENTASIAVVSGSVFASRA
jgi:[ribosomal protein S5]-alanine N-acetyltransferase